jgi:hypothetical protein
LTIPEDGLDFAAAFASMGGLGCVADDSKIELHRALGERSIHTLEEIKHGVAGKIKLCAGDRIFVAQCSKLGNYVSVTGHVKKRGLLLLPPDGKLDLLTVIDSCGGLDYLASGKIELIREGVTLRFLHDDLKKKGAIVPLLKPGDYITLPPQCGF